MNRTQHQRLSVHQPYCDARPRTYTAWVKV